MLWWMFERGIACWNKRQGIWASLGLVQIGDNMLRTIVSLCPVQLERLELWLFLSFLHCILHIAIAVPVACSLTLTLLLTLDSVLPLTALDLPMRIIAWHAPWTGYLTTEIENRLKSHILKTIVGLTITNKNHRWGLWVK
jgi:hypothetical protein